MSEQGIRRVTVEIDLAEFESDLSVGGYHGLGRSVADRIAPYVLPVAYESEGRTYGMKVVSDSQHDGGSVGWRVGPSMAFCLGALSATAIILIGVGV